VERRGLASTWINGAVFEMLLPGKETGELRVALQRDQN
jgi:hypothetical protein